MWSHKRNETMSLTEDFAIDLAPMMKNARWERRHSAEEDTARRSPWVASALLTLALNRCEKIYGNVFLT